MRIDNLSIILSIGAASIVAAAPWSTKEIIEKQEILLQSVEASGKLDCVSCVTLLGTLKELSKVSTTSALDSLNKLCMKYADVPTDVCTGLVDLQGPIGLDVLNKADLSDGDAKYICYQLAGICSTPDVTSGNVTFPKPRPDNVTIPSPSGHQVDVLHISDWHVDPDYVPGSEAVCGYPTCCRTFQDSPAVPVRAAASWGDYNCGTPQKLADDMIQNIPKFTNASFSIMTGDIPPHDIWLETQSTVIPKHQAAYSTMSKLNITFYPTIGNHETGPTNLFPTLASGGNSSWLYDSLANDWSQWLPVNATNYARNYGAYTVSPQPGFRIISLNTNFCYTLNLYLYADIADFDPNSQVQWLVEQLQAAEDAHERVWIIGHVAPSQTDCLQNWSSLYYQVVQRYSPHVIAEQFFGHSHWDEFAVYYNSDVKSNQSAISTGWIAPSVTPFTDINPGFRVYKVDNGTWNIYESYTYIANLSLASTWDNTNSTPEWKLEYSARQAYGQYAPIADNEPLSPSWWHTVTEAFSANDTAFQDYWTYRGKSALRLPACDNTTSCQNETICDLRAGKSSDSCTPIAFIGASSLDYSDEVPISFDQYRQKTVRPWVQKNCGLFN
ncbi:hypothetical protein BGZ76_009144 [Entomortierella beljakovae]|nr:hypothetical protein BGZ76_009144 [Entomortierella beljakovae]